MKKYIRTQNVEVDVPILSAVTTSDIARTLTEDQLLSIYHRYSLPNDKFGPFVDVSEMEAFNRVVDALEDLGYEV